MTIAKPICASIVLLVAAAASSQSFAQGQGPGPCTRPGNYAVGIEGPAMSGGQLMAGVGQCRRIASWGNSYASDRGPWHRGRGYGHRDPEYGYGATGFGFGGGEW